MFTVDGILKFHRWTHLCLDALLDHLSAIPTEVYEKELSDFGFSTLRAQMIHIFNCEGLWVHTLQGLNHVDRRSTEYPEVADAKRLQQEVRRQTIAYLSNLTDQELNSDTELRFSDGDVAARTPALVLHHVLTHAFHHKGQVVAMCRILGHPARDTDLNQFE